MMEFRELIKNTRIDFIGMRRVAFALSGVFLEHMAKMKVREDFGNVINRSINEVLSRTIVTNLTTFLVTVALALLGG